VLTASGVNQEHLIRVLLFAKFNLTIQRWFVRAISISQRTALNGLLPPSEKIENPRKTFPREVSPPTTISGMCSQHCPPVPPIRFMERKLSWAYTRTVFMAAETMDVLLEAQLSTYPTTIT